jgi:hypothetical protein
MNTLKLLIQILKITTMKNQLFKTDEYFYVLKIDNIIPKGKYYYNTGNIDDGEHNIHIATQDIVESPAELEIIATTNPSLPLPQIANASDDIVDKEVEVEFTEEYVMGSLDEPITIAILKPISKETSISLVKDCDTCANNDGGECQFASSLLDDDTRCISYNKWQNCNETSTNETLNCVNCSKYNNCSCEGGMILEQCFTSNETLEEVALKLSEQFEKNKDGFEEQSDFYYGVLAGYKHCEKTLPSYDDVSHAIAYARSQTKYGLSHEQILIEYNKVHRKPYVKHCEKTMYSEYQLQSEICKHNAQTIKNCEKTMYSEKEIKSLIISALSNYHNLTKFDDNCYNRIPSIDNINQWFNSNKK